MIMNLATGAVLMRLPRPRSVIVLALFLLLFPTGPARASSGRYHITARDGGAVLMVDAVLGPMHTLALSVSDGAEAFVRHVEVLHDGHWQAVPRGRNCWVVPAWGRHGVHVRYRFDAAAAGGKLHDIGIASTHGRVYHVCPEGFLLRSWDSTPGLVRFSVATSGNTRFVTGVRQVDTHVWQLRAQDIDLAPDAAFGPLTVVPMELPGARFSLAYVSHGLPLSDSQMRRWVRQKTLEVVRYFERFPRPRGLVLILPDDGATTDAHARGGSGWSVCLSVGRLQTVEAIRHDTVLTHEMVHVCTPGLHSAQHWMEEGIATYLEQLIPAQAGDLTPVEMWQAFTDELPKGQPCHGDRGLNRDCSDDRTYYGGAIFWFMADVRIRTVTNGQRSLRDALLAFNRAGGNITSLWKVQRLLRLGDRAIGAPVLHRLYARMASRPYKANLHKLWKRLGVVREGRVVHFRAAPLANIRRSMTHPARTVVSTAPPAATYGYISRLLSGPFDILEDIIP